MPLFVVTLIARKAGEDDRYRASDKIVADDIKAAKAKVMKTSWDPQLEEQGWRPIVAVEWAEAPSLHGITVRRVNNTIFVPLPRELWRDAGGCCCRYCSPVERESRESYWDTLAISADEKSPRTHLVHAPEYHGVKPKRGS